MGDRILIVEGLTPVSDALSKQLQRHGYELDMARSLREALLLTQTGRWDAVVLNVGLPAMNGVELYTPTKCDRGRECLPLIFTAGYTKQGLLKALWKGPRASEPARPASVCLFLSRLERCLRNEPARVFQRAGEAAI